uniref:Kinetochore-associated protein 1 n=1 Tax=Timema tahoe TaxID=61484 RepID=A0A7R9I9M6_9NEOP|nr:unnamed protein product [Timema tahoe]
MSRWDLVDTEFDKEDNTLNFGTRNIAKGDGCLYDCHTLASLQAMDQVDCVPHVTAYPYSNGGMCLVIDKSMFVFSDETYSQLLLNLVLCSTIDCFALTRDGQFLVVITRAGELHCVHIPSDGEVILSRSLQGDYDENATNCNFVEIFIQHKENAKSDIIVISCLGEVFRISDLDFALYPSFLENKETMELTNSMKHVQVECLRKGSDDIKSSWLQIQRSWVRPPALTVSVKHLLIALKEDAHLALIDPNMLCFLRQFTKHLVQDFILLDKVYEEDEAAVLVCSKPDDHMESYIFLASLPEMKVKYKLKTSPASYLVASASSPEQEIFLEGVHAADKTEFIDTLRLKAIVESLPDLRFDRLLRRNKFDEAELFAKHYGLDSSLVDKARAKQFIKYLQPSSIGPNNKDTLFADLLALLDKICDVGFVCELCENAILYNLEQTRCLLKYAQGRLNSSHTMDGHSDLLSRVFGVLSRLDTYQVVYNNEKYDMNHWLVFSTADLLKESKLLTSQGKLKEAAIIWSRHFSTFKHKLTDTLLSDVLNAIPPNVTVEELLHWLCFFTPSLIGHSKLQALLISWGIDKTKGLEMEKLKWPKNALEFSERFLTLQNYNNKLGEGLHSVVNWYRLSSIPSSPLSQLVVLINTLKELKTLKDDYHVCIPLEDYMQEDKKQVIFYLLDKVNPSDIHRLMTSFLFPFMLKCRLESDQVLLEYIIGVTIRVDWRLWYKESPWEDNMATIIHFIHNSTVQMQSIVLSLRNAPVPWSATMKALAQEGLKREHPLATNIADELVMEKVKLVQKKYGLKHLAIRSKDLTEEVYVRCIEHYITMGNLERAIKILDSLSPPLVKKCCLRIIRMTEALFQDDFLGDICRNFKEISDLIFTRLTRASTLLGEDTMVDIIDFKNLSMIFKEFVKKMTPYEFGCMETRWRIVKECIRDSVLTLPMESDEQLHIVCGKVSRLAALFKLCPEEVVIELVQQALDLNNFQVAVGVLGNATFYLFGLCSYVVITLMLIRMRKVIHTSMEEEWKSVLEKLPSVQPAEFQTLISPSLEVSTEAVGNSCLSQRLWDKLHILLSRLICGNGSLVRSLPQTARQLSFDACVNCSPGYISLLLQQKRVKHRLDYGSMAISRKCYWFVRVVVVGIKMAILVSAVKISPLVNILQKEENYFTLLQGLLAYNTAMYQWQALKQHNSFYKEKVEPELYSVLKNCVHALFLKVAWGRKPDIHFCVSLLLLLSANEVFKYLNTAISRTQDNCRRLESVAKIGIMYNKLNGLCENEAKLQKLLIKCKWSKRFKSFKISHKDLLNLDFTSLRQNLITSKHTTLDLIREFCYDFNVDLQECLISYLEFLITSWDPHIVVSEDAKGKEEGIVTNPEETVLKKCNDIDKSKLWKFLAHELNLDTYNSWLTVSSIFGFEKDWICSIALKETVIARLGTVRPEGWCLHHLDSHLFQQIEQCMTKFNNLERAGASLYHIANHMPQGVDQVTIAELCYKYTKRWAKEVVTVEAKERLVKVKSTYLRCATSNILHLYGLGVPCYLKLASAPEELMVTLYEDPSIITRDRGALQHCPDVNEVVRQLAALHKVDLFNFWQDQLKARLSPEAGVGGNLLDETTINITTMLNSSMRDPDLDDENLIRACYMLGLIDSHTSANYLITLVFDNSEERLGSGVRLRALQCLVATIEEDLLQKLTCLTIAEIMEHQKCLMFTSQLDALGIFYSGQLQECNKVDLVKVLWSRHGRSHPALVLIAQLCLHYKMFQREIWEPLLTQMVSFNMVRELETVLPQLNEQFHILSLSLCIQAWNKVLLRPFLSVVPPLTDKQEAACFGSLMLLQCCPIVSTIDLRQIEVACTHLQRPDLLALVAPFIEAQLHCND